MKYQKIKRNQVDKCNICGKESHLTWDHVPPKSCYNNGPIKYNPFFKGIPNEKYEGEFQSGIRFRSLCENCNNNLLGAKYDPELNRFTLKISELVQSPVILPEKMYLKCNINKIARAVCGHLIAAVNSYPDGQIYEELRKFLLDETALPPLNRKLLYRIYPYSTVIINQGFLVENVLAKKKKGDFPKGACIMMSCYPIAYLLCDDDNSGLLNLFDYCTDDIEDIIEFPIIFKSCFYNNTSIFRHFLWPCNIGDDDYYVDLMLGGDENIIGVQKINRRESQKGVQ